MTEKTQAEMMGLSAIEHAAWNLFYNMEEVGGVSNHNNGAWFKQEYVTLRMALEARGLNTDPEKANLDIPEVDYNDVSHDSNQLP